MHRDHVVVVLKTGRGDAVLAPNRPPLSLMNDQSSANSDPRTTEDLDSMSSRDLVCHIIERHHGYLRRELPRIAAFTEKIAHAQGAATPELRELRDAFVGFRTRMLLHMETEEAVVFPLFREDAAAPDDSALHGIDDVARDHEDVDRDIENFRRLTREYQVPDNASTTYRDMIAALADLEEDLRFHAHLENQVLYRRLRAGA